MDMIKFDGLEEVKDSKGQADILAKFRVKAGVHGEERIERFDANELSNIFKNTTNKIHRLEYSHAHRKLGAAMQSHDLG